MSPLKTKTRKKYILWERRNNSPKIKFNALRSRQGFPAPLHSELTPPPRPEFYRLSLLRPPPPIRVPPTTTHLLDSHDCPGALISHVSTVMLHPSGANDSHDYPIWPGASISRVAGNVGQPKERRAGSHWGNDAVSSHLFSGEARLPG